MGVKISYFLLLPSIRKDKNMQNLHIFKKISLFFAKKFKEKNLLFFCKMCKFFLFFPKGCVDIFKRFSKKCNFCVLDLGGFKLRA